MSDEPTTTSSPNEITSEVRRRYAAAARAAGDGQVAVDTFEEPTASKAAQCCGPSGTNAPSEPVSCCSGSPEPQPGPFGSGLYDATDLALLPTTAARASLGCGNPTAVAELRAGERVLDLGSGGGIDVLISAQRVGPSGFAYGVDMTPEMIELARRNAREAGAENVEFRQGSIEDLPFEDGSVDAVISNCVINLSTDKAAVLTEAFRVLAPGGRLGISDVVAEDHLTPDERAERGSYSGCIAGALSRAEYLTLLAESGFDGAEVTFTQDVTEGMHNAIIRAHKPEASND